MELPEVEGNALATTPLGMLQRGRGDGWRRAAESADGAWMLRECLARDPRWDWQAESRDGYYATLAARLGIPVTELEELANATDDDGSLAGDVLLALRDRGSREATAALRRLPSYDWLFEPRGEYLAPTDPPSTASLAELLDAPVFRWICIPQRLATFDRPENLAVLRHRAREVGAGGWDRALLALAIRGDDIVLDVIEPILIANQPGRVRATAARAADLLPSAVALPLARSWIATADGRGDVAGSLFALRAETRDAPAIRRALSVAADYYTVSSLVEALGRLPDAGPFPELEDVYVEASYSYARTRAAAAIARTDADFTEKWGLECLWDCEPETRLLGVRRAPPGSEATARMADLSDDPGEDDDVRRAALSRLQRDTGAG